MTKQEWLQRCAARYVEKAGVTQGQADDFAEVQWDILTEDNQSHEDHAPDDCADEDMEEWVRNT